MTIRPFPLVLTLALGAAATQAAAVPAEIPDPMPLEARARAVASSDAPQAELVAMESFPSPLAPESCSRHAWRFTYLARESRQRVEVYAQQEAAGDACPWTFVPVVVALGVGGHAVGTIEPFLARLGDFAEARRKAKALWPQQVFEAEQAKVESPFEGATRVHYRFMGHVCGRWADVVLDAMTLDVQRASSLIPSCP